MACSFYDFCHCIIVLLACEWRVVLVLAFPGAISKLASAFSCPWTFLSFCLNSMLLSSSIHYSMLGNTYITDENENKEWRWCYLGKHMYFDVAAKLRLFRFLNEGVRCQCECSFLTAFLWNRFNCALSFPRRVLIPWLGDVFVSDYLQPSEALEVCTPNFHIPYHFVWQITVQKSPSCRIRAFCRFPIRSIYSSADRLKLCDTLSLSQVLRMFHVPRVLAHAASQEFSFQWLPVP